MPLSAARAPLDPLPRLPSSDRRRSCLPLPGPLPIAGLEIEDELSPDKETLVYKVHAPLSLLMKQAEKHNLKLTLRPEVRLLPGPRLSAF